MSDLNPHHPSPPRVVLRRVPIFSGRKKTFSQYTPLDVGRYRSKPNSPVLKISVINPPEYGNPIIFFPYLSNHSFSLTISSFYYTMSLCHSPQSPRLSLSLSLLPSCGSVRLVVVVVVVLLLAVVTECLCLYRVYLSLPRPVPSYNPTPPLAHHSH